MTWFERFEQHKSRYLYLLMGAYFFINSTINATSDWMEETRDGVADFHIIEPFLWEYSSAISILLLLPLLAIFWQGNPLQLTQIKSQLGKHLVASLVFSILHVSIMVLIREIAYWSAGGNYDFGPILREFIYEYRKDVWSYAFFLLFYQLYQFVYSRLKGEANLIDAEPEQQSPTHVPEHLLVKKLDREFLVKVDDIQWMESAGNYVNLHSGGRIYPLRSTLADLSKRLAEKGFCRTHRSYAVNFSAIDHISYQPSGDGEICLKNGTVVALSRRYKDEFKKCLE
ncbi:LytR/AlgR family response regulator transcription factor [Paraglaciecola arctica]|uniref:Response regulator receiver domain-containing protein n=1 Tax=Paraglaciecola arctica BSs20135 TaxID=493475 RepID=K6Y2J6_9ALTE|nr:LytTR family DNA-binding domain-containing protein [Paraglaciecola arctica]GAC18171.1 response regulator receiver domain-containing protein [Paraglaciecola arctica BSs20135]